MLNKIDKWILLFMLPFLWVSGTALKPERSPHPFYISVTEINHNATNKTLEISCKVFIDDLEATLKKNFHTAVDLSNAALQDRSGVLVDKYVQQHLHISANGKPAVLKFIGFEKVSESVYCYFEAAGVTAVKKLDVDNSLLQDFTQEQINIMHVTAGGRRQSTKLNFPERNASFSF